MRSIRIGLCNTGNFLLGIILSLVLCLGMIPTTAFAANSTSSKQAFAVYDDIEDGLYFFNRETVPNVGDVIDGVLVSEVYTKLDLSDWESNVDLFNFNNTWFNFDYYSWWDGDVELSLVPRHTFSIVEVVDTGISPNSTAWWFCNFYYTVEFNLSKLDTSNTIDMNHMFAYSRNLHYLDLSTFDTSNVTNMSDMFNMCYNLQSLNINNFNTNNVNNMSCMFGNCPKLKSLDLSSFGTSNVTNMNRMFENYLNFSNIYVSDSWDTNKVASSINMFYACWKLPNFDENITDKTKAHYNDGGYLTYKPYGIRKYNAYKIFSGDVDSTNGTMSNLDWSSPEAKTIILEKLGLLDTITPQQAAETLKAQVGLTDKSTILSKTNVGMEIAKAIQILTPSKQIPVNTETPIENGYYILTAATFDNPTQNTMASSPIYAVIGTGSITITEKSSLPALSLQIKEDKGGINESWATVADHSYGQLVDYKAMFSLPMNFVSFSNYQTILKLSSNGYDFANISNNNIKIYHVKVDEAGTLIDSSKQEMTTGFTITNNGIASKDSNQIGLIILFDKLSTTANVDANSRIVVDFKAPASSDKNNRKMFALLEYSSNPIASSEIGQTPWQVVDDYSYNMKFTKQDKATSAPLANAVFKVKNKDGVYIARDAAGKAFEMPAGTAEANAYEWVTGADGILNISGVDADEYVVKEVVAPNSYTPLANEFSIVMTSNYDNPLSPTVSGALGGTYDVTLVSLLDTPASGFAADVIVKNVKNLNLPFTGEQGIAMLIVFGSILAIVGFGVQVRKRRRLSVDLDMVNYK